MKLRDRIRRHSRDNRLIVSVLAVLFVLLAAVFYLILRARDLPSYLITDQLLLFVLFYVNGILILVILFVLLRNVYKLAVERHHRILGSKFKVKLVLSFVGLSLIPVLLLFFVATELFQGTMDRWFSTQVREVREQGNVVAEAWSDQIESTALRDARQVRRAIADLDLADPGAKPELARRLQVLLADLELDLLAVYAGRDFVQATLDPQAGVTDLPEAPRDLLARALEDGSAVRRLQPAGVPGPLVLAAVGPEERGAEGTGPGGPEDTGEPGTFEGDPEGGAPPDSVLDDGFDPTSPAWAPPPAALRPDDGEDAPVVVVGVLLDPALAQQVRELQEAFLAFRQVEVQRDNLAASHLLTFLMVTLLIILASSWTGLYLARRVTVPIQALATGTRKVALGDLDHQVETEADDELGVLVHSFNRMTQELRRNKEVIERSNAELTEANRDLAEERSLIAAVLDNVAAGVVSIDAEGRILTCNGAALAILQQSMDDVLGRPVAEAWADPERSRLAALLEVPRGSGRRRTAGRRHTEEIHLRLGNEWKVLDVKVTPLRSGGAAGPLPGAVAGAEAGGGAGVAGEAGPAGGAAASPGDGEWVEGPADRAGEAPGETLGGGPAGGGRVLVLEDLTELLKAQQTAAWSEAARRIAHEIKNPLTPIQLSAERLLRKYRQGDPDLGEALEEGVEVIVREVDTLQEMVDEFSRYARMPRPHPTRTDVARLVGETLDLYRDIKSGVVVDSDLDGGLDAVSLDPQQIRRALINLIDNAIEATDAPGRVTVAAHRADGHLEIHVADTGRGIPPEARDKLFLPYFSTKGRGTGLGLAIVHRIVSDHRGRIRVEDNRPKGTVFILELPLR